MQLPPCQSSGIKNWASTVQVPCPRPAQHQVAEAGAQTPKRAVEPLGIHRLSFGDSDDSRRSRILAACSAPRLG